MKILIIRFSSFGDVLQSLSIAGALQKRFPDAEIHWVTREDFAPLIRSHPAVKKIWTIGRSESISGLLKLARRLRSERFTHVYDAHNNLRSHVIGWVMWRFGGMYFLRRSIYRWRRFLLFRFRINKFPKPFSGQFALLEPLRKWGVEPTAPPPPQLFISKDILPALQKKFLFLSGDYVTIAASAAFPLKRWPVEYWRELVGLAAATTFVLLGGPEDSFLAEIASVDPRRVHCLAGRLSLIESAAVVSGSSALISNDTGLMHVAEQIGKPCVALMGPAPFGFPSRPLTEILEVSLWCRPCSKHGQGPCINPEFHKCLRDIKPARVMQALQKGVRR